MLHQIELKFSSSGVHIAVNIDATLVEHLRESLPPDAKASLSGSVQRSYQIRCKEDDLDDPLADQFVLYADSIQLGSSNHLADLLQMFEKDSRIFVAEMATERVILHAGVVAWKGKAIVLPGRSWSGKTTLVAALVEAGAGYLSDEYAVLDREGRVHPYLKPLSIREADNGPTRVCTAEELGGSDCAHPLEVALVLVTRYEAGAIWRPEQLNAADALLAIAQDSVSIRRSPALVLEVLKRLVLSVPVVRGPRGETQQIVNYLSTKYQTW